MASTTTLAAMLSAALLAAAAVPAAAIERGSTADGRSYITGGVGFEEREQLALLRGDYSLFLVCAARGSGAFLSDVRVRITDDRGRVVFDRALDGPELLVDLKPGRYTIEANAAGETQRTQTTIDANARREAYLYFDVEADVLPRESKARH